MNCDCISRVNDKLKDAGHQYAVDAALVFDRKMNASDNLQIPTHWTDGKRHTKKPPALLCTFCPFCGTKVITDTPAEEVSEPEVAHAV
jgi:hypothetical protein